MGTIDLYEGNAVLHAGIASRLAKTLARMGDEARALAVVDEELSKLGSGESESVRHLKAIADLLEVQLSILKQKDDQQGSTDVANRLKDYQDSMRKRIGSIDGK